MNDRSDDSILELKTPIAKSSVFGCHTEAIEYYLTELITDIHLAGDSQGTEAIDHAQSLLGTCHTLMGYLFCHADTIRERQKHMRQFDGILPLKQN